MTPSLAACRVAAGLPLTVMRRACLSSVRARFSGAVAPRLFGHFRGAPQVIGTVAPIAIVGVALVFPVHRWRGASAIAHAIGAGRMDDADALNLHALLLP